jgi:hypothetical protein
MKSNTDVCKGLYIEALTAEIFTKLGPFLNTDITDEDSNRAQGKIKQIIAREYVEKEDQIIHGKQIHKNRKE